MQDTSSFRTEGHVLWKPRKDILFNHHFDISLREVRGPQLARAKTNRFKFTNFDDALRRRQA